MVDNQHTVQDLARAQPTHSTPHLYQRLLLVDFDPSRSVGGSDANQHVVSGCIGDGVERDAKQRDKMARMVL